VNEIEVGKLLAMAITLDPKMPEPDEAGFMRRLWTATLHDVPVELAQRALVEYYRSDRYAQTRETISPADIVQWSHARRRPSESERTGLNSATRREAPRPELDPQRIHDGVDRVHAALGVRRAIASGEDPELAVEIAQGEAAARREFLSRACPWCRAQAGRPCTDGRGRELTRTPAHPSRLDAAQVAAREDTAGSSRA